MWCVGARIRKTVADFSSIPLHITICMTLGARLRGSQCYGEIRTWYAKTVIATRVDNLDILVANKRLADWPLEAAQQPRRELLLRERLRPLWPSYDLIIYDAPPSPGLFSLSVMLAAGDTFRAAAVEQLQSWGERNNVPVIAQHTGADSASVIYDAVDAATARGVDVLIADTAGRLSNKAHLMEELEKVVRVLRKQNPAAPHEVMLVVDGGTGQNALQQAIQFNEAVGLTGITITKLDGTARGGILFAIADKLRVPIRFIGVGEGIDDLRPFDSGEFIDALFEA